VGREVRLALGFRDWPTVYGYDPAEVDLGARTGGAKLICLGGDFRRVR
jgi:hypothetical protein